MTKGMCEKGKRALRCLPEPAIDKIGCTGYCGLLSRARVPSFLMYLRSDEMQSVRKPTVYAGVQGTFSPLLGQNRGWGGSRLAFPFFVEPIQLKEIF